MDLALHFPGFTRANQLHVRDSLSPSSEKNFSRTAFDGDRRSWPGDKAWSSSLSRRSKKGYVVCCKNPSDEQSSSPSRSKQEEIISLLSRIQASISKGQESQGADEKNGHASSSGQGSLSKAILDVLEKPREKTEGEAGVRKERPKTQVARPPSRFTKRSPTRPSASDPGKLPITKSRLEETETEEKPPLIETMKLAELKEVAKKRGLKGYSKLKKSEILELLRSS